MLRLMAHRDAGRGPKIVVTLGDAASQADPALATRKNDLYLDGIRRHGGEPLPLDPTSSEADRRAAFEVMEGLLLSGGADIDPGRYGEPGRGSVSVEPSRDDLEADAWAAAESKRLPVLGICRGLQAINVFSGGRLIQHIDGHRGPAWERGTALQHPLRIVPGTRLARILFPANIRGGVLRVNSFHHQGVRPDDLAPGLIANAWAPSKAGDIVEGLEAVGNRIVLGVQCHPERLESTPPELERLFAFFVDACRGALVSRG